MPPFLLCREPPLRSIARHFGSRLHHLGAGHVVVVVLSQDASQARAIIAERLAIWPEIVGHRAVVLQDRAIYKIHELLVADFKHNKG